MRGTAARAGAGGRPPRRDPDHRQPRDRDLRARARARAPRGDRRRGGDRSVPPDPGHRADPRRVPEARLLRCQGDGAGRSRRPARQPARRPAGLPTRPPIRQRARRPARSDRGVHRRRGPPLDGRGRITGLPPEVSLPGARALVALGDGDPFDYDLYDAAKQPLRALVEDAGYAHVDVRATVVADPVAAVATRALRDHARRALQVRRDPVHRDPAHGADRGRARAPRGSRPAIATRSRRSSSRRSRSTRSAGSRRCRSSPIAAAARRSMSRSSWRRPIATRSTAAVALASSRRPTSLECAAAVATCRRRCRCSPWRPMPASRTRSRTTSIGRSSSPRSGG